VRQKLLCNLNILQYKLEKYHISHDSFTCDILIIAESNQQLLTVLVPPYRIEYITLILEEIMKKQLLLVFVAGSLFTFAFSGSAHCEIPCGIYDDAMRIKLLNEHIATIEKSMVQIVKLEKAKKINDNQLVRWINNKEEHANKLQKIVTQYFMTQRVKPGQPDYLKKLTLLHQMLIYGMKCKQTTDLKNPKKLKELVKSFAASYLKKQNKHSHDKHH
jgi:nickel superoxide dismutase